MPSKVLSNMCAAKPQLLAVPPENLAAQIVEREAAGIIVPPSDIDAWLAAADRLLDDRQLRDECGRNARRYAERAFDIEKKTDAFEAVLHEAVSAP